jgi:hypothetical protein
VEASAELRLQQNALQSEHVAARERHRFHESRDAVLDGRIRHSEPDFHCPRLLAMHYFSLGGTEISATNGRLSRELPAQNSLLSFILETRARDIQNQNCWYRGCRCPRRGTTQNSPPEVGVPSV